MLYCGQRGYVVNEKLMLWTTCYPQHKDVIHNICAQYMLSFSTMCTDPYAVGTRCGSPVISCGLHIVDYILWTRRHMLWILKHILWIIYVYVVDNNDEYVLHNIGNVIHIIHPQYIFSFSTICVDLYVVGTRCGSPVISCGLHVVNYILWIRRHILWVMYIHVVDNDDEYVVHNIYNVIHIMYPQYML